MLERLQKIIARAGIASRRHAEELIRAGQVRVNGVVVTELGAKADPERDRVEAAGRVAERPAELATISCTSPATWFPPCPIPRGEPRCATFCADFPAAFFPSGGSITRLPA